MVFQMIIEIGKLYRNNALRWLQTKEQHIMDQVLEAGDVVLIVEMRDVKMKVIDQKGRTGWVYLTAKELSDTTMESICNG